MKLIRIKSKSVYTNAPYLRPLIFTLFIYLAFVYLLTLNPFHFSLKYFNQYIQFKKGVFTTLVGGSSIDDIILNLVMLYPLGIVTGSVFRILKIKLKTSVIIATCLGFIISLSIEFCQLFLSRSTSTIDIITNTTSACLGARLAYPVGRFDFQHILNILYCKGRLFYSRLVFVYCVVAAIIFMIPMLVNNFSNWNSTYHLLIGNEGTMNRPWKGQIYKLSIFNQALNDSEINELYKAGFKQESPVKFSSELLLEVIFSNPNIIKFGQLKDKINFALPDDNSSALTDQSGIRLIGKAPIRTEKPPIALVHSLQQTSQISIAIWFAPDNLEQDGPARIISLSRDTNYRNFTLSQSDLRLNFRVRTPLTGSNGSKVELTTHQLLTTKESQFVVATFHRGESKIFYNGQLVLPIITDISYYLPLLLGLNKYYFDRFAFCFMLLFPLGWLVRGLVSVKIWKSIISSLLVNLPFIISSTFSILYLDHSYDVQLFLICCFISILLLIIGISYDLFFAE